MTAVPFDYSAWQFRYPELAEAVPNGLAGALYAEAGIYLDPGDTSPVTDPTQRLVILGMIVAHLAALQLSETGKAGLVGRVASATTGSVSVSLAAVALPNSAEWWAQTKYGFSAWQAMAPFRTMRYIPGPYARPPYGRVAGFRRF